MPTPANMIPPDIIFAQNQEMQFADVPVNMAVDSTMPIISQVSEINSAITAIEIMGYIWLAGFIALLAYAVIGYINLKRRICFATLVRDNIYETDRIKSPFVLGFIRPKIYFPTNIDPSRYDYILNHEQIHIKRRDYLIKPFAYIVFALHWFNPIMWIAYFLMSKDMEMSCDEAVLKKTDEDIRCDYSTSLLSLSTKRVSLLNLTAFSYGEGNVKERINNVLRFKKSQKWVTIASIILVSVFLVGFSLDRMLSDERGVVVGSHEEAHEVGMRILNEYFSVFSHDWERWEVDQFYLSTFYAEVDLNGDSIAPWLHGRVSENVEGGRFFTPPFMFFIDAETGWLESVNYFPPTTEYILTSLAPFEISIEEAYALYGDWWFWGEPLPIDLRSEYMDILIDFSLELLDESGFSPDAIISIDSIVGGNFANNFVNPNIHITFADGVYVNLSFWVFETHFSITGFGINF